MEHPNSRLNHIIENWTYANEAARLAASGFLSVDVGKIAFVTATKRYWRLNATTPTWVSVGALPDGGLTSQVLTKVSGADQDANWQTPGGGGGSTFVIGTPAALGTDQFITFSTISQAHKHIRIRGVMANSGASDDVRLQINADTGHHYAWNQLLTTSTSVTGTAANHGNYTTTGETSIKLGASNGSDGLHFILDIPEYSTDYTFDPIGGRQVFSMGMWPVSAIASYRNVGKYGNFDTFAAAPVTSLKFFIATGVLIDISKLSMELIG